MEAKKTCCFIGSYLRNSNLIFHEDNNQFIHLKQIMFNNIVELIKHNYVINFISDMSLEIGIYSAEIILLLKPLYPEISMECVLSYEEQSTNWTTDQRNRYFNILEKCDKETMFQKKYTKTCIMMAKRYMIDHSEYVLAVWNGKHNNMSKIIQYAKSKERQIILINPYEL